MNTFKKGNIALSDFKKFLEREGLKQIRIKGGHYIYTRADLKRSITLQTHIDPVPEFIVLQILHTLNLTTAYLEDSLKPKKGSETRNTTKARRGKRS